MINDREFLYGAAFLRIINFGVRVSLTHLSQIHSSVYLLATDQTTAIILFKISTKPTSAWSFVFSSQEEEGIIKLQNYYSDVMLFIGLICHRDGICCLSKNQLFSILDDKTIIKDQRIAVSRKPRSSYHINGMGKVSLDCTIPQSNFPRILFEPNE